MLFLKLHNEWVELARIDYYAMLKLSDDEYLAPMVLFHAQQCIEKLFKAILEQNGLDIPRVHSTKRLYDIVFEFVKKPIDVDSLYFIDSVYIESRYPASFGLLPDGGATQRESKRAIEIVDSVLDALSLDFMANIT